MHRLKYVMRLFNNKIVFINFLEINFFLVVYFSTYLTRYTYINLKILMRKTNADRNTCNRDFFSLLVNEG